MPQSPAFTKLLLAGCVYFSFAWIDLYAVMCGIQCVRKGGGIKEEKIGQHAESHFRIKNLLLPSQT